MNFLNDKRGVQQNFERICRAYVIAIYTPVNDKIATKYSHYVLYRSFLCDLNKSKGVRSSMSNGSLIARKKTSSVNIRNNLMNL